MTETGHPSPVYSKPEERPLRSPTIAKLAAALAKAQGQIENADKDAKGTYGKYATLAATWDAIRKPLAENKIAVYQRILTMNGRSVMATMLIHASGEFIDDCELELKFDSSGRMNAMQAMGSAVTYARRYSLQSVTGVAPADDDDGVASGDPKGNQGQGQQQKPQTNQKPASRPPAQKPQWKHPVQDDVPGFYHELPPEAFDQHPPDEPIGDPDAPENYVMPLGSDEVKGKRLGQLPEKKLLEILDWAEKELKKTPPAPNMGKIFEVSVKVKAFLKSAGVQ